MKIAVLPLKVLLLLLAAHLYLRLEGGISRSQVEISYVGRNGSLGEK
jgi:hypothetical protein